MMMMTAIMAMITVKKMVKDHLRSIANSPDNLFCAVNLLHHADRDVGSLDSYDGCDMPYAW